MTRQRLSALFLGITAVGVVHMGEQILFGIEELYMLRESLSGWYGLFPEGFADRATVLLITIVFSTVSLLLYLLMRGGAAALAVFGLFGVLGVTEAHHWVEAIGAGAYDPGLVTSFAYVLVGGLILVEVGRELLERVAARGLPRPRAGVRPPRQAR